MKITLISLSLCILIVYADEKYTSKYDNINIDDIIKSDRLTRRYLDCALDKAPCTADGEELKKNIPDALKTGCSKCTEKQNVALKKVLYHLTKNRHSWFEELTAKFDPKGEFTKKFEDEVFSKEIS